MRFPLFWVSFFLSITLRAENTWKLSEAIKQGLVTAEITGGKSGDGIFSAHYGPCMEIRLSGKMTSAIALNLDYGYKLEPLDTNLQTMMVTKSLAIKLQPGEARTEKIYAMCTKATHRSPSSDQGFRVGKLASGYLLGLAELINRKNYQNDAGQSAVWCLTNGYELGSIYSADTSTMYDLRRFVAKAMGIPLSKIYESVPSFSFIEPQNMEPHYTTQTVYSGSFSYSISRPSKVLIALFDEGNHMKKVYVNNQDQRSGEYTYSYKIGSNEMDGKNYHLRMFRDGKMEEDISLTDLQSP
jgi:hypothetical protein